MASEPGGSSGSGDAFDIRAIRQLVKLMNENELAEIDLRNGENRVRLRKRGSEIVPVVSAPAPFMPAPAPSAPPSESKGAAPSEPAKPYLEIKSPMLGTFYRAPSPDAEPFVQVGDHVDRETIVCVIEAMKVFNEIASEVTGKIVAVLVENAQPVEYGQVLFRVDPTG